MDAIAFGKSIGALVRESVAKAIGDIAARLGALEQHLAELPTPQDGKSVTVEEVRPMVAELVDAAVKQIPTPKDGASVVLSDVAPALLPPLQKQMREAIAALPVPQDGKSVSLDEVVQALLPGVEKSVEALQARWALDFERRAQGILERAVDRLPKPKDGEDGLDGFGFEDLAVEHDGERGFVLRFTRGERVKEFAFTVPVVLDRGFWLEGKAVEAGDGVTFGGSYWIAQRATATKPEIGNPDWRLAVKKGRDGK